MLGVNRGTVQLAAHSNQWGKLFLHEKARLEGIIGEEVVDIQHFGSTAIFNIKAKPIIDILIGVRSMDDIERFDLKKLKGIAIYRLKVVLDGKVVFAKFSDLKNGTKTHILHVVEYKGDWWNKHIFLRDYLNAHPKAATEYENLKEALAEKYATNEIEYTNRKKAFVDQILEKDE